ncbi:MAG: type II toxin-antitoxin system VapC family toxin [Terracidiphilus sp.]
MTVYSDSSFLVSSYVDDAHSVEADRRMGSRPDVWLTPFHRAEFAHALYQQVFRSRFSEGEAQRAWNHFEQDCANGIWTPIDLPERTWDTSVDLARRYGPTLGVRTVDSLHIACALELKAQRFWTFDERQARLAEAVGLDTSA